MKGYREQQTGSLICPSNFALSSADAQFMPRLGHGTGSWGCCRHHICPLDLARVIVDAEKWCCLIQQQSHGAKSDYLRSYPFGNYFHLQLSNIYIYVNVYVYNWKSDKWYIIGLNFWPIDVNCKWPSWKTVPRHRTTAATQSCWGFRQGTAARHISPHVPRWCSYLLQNIRSVLPDIS